MKKEKPSALEKKFWKEQDKVNESLRPWVLVLGVAFIAFIGCIEGIAVFLKRSHGIPSWLIIGAFVTFGIAASTYLFMYMAARSAMERLLPVFKSLYPPAPIRFNKENPPPVEAGERGMKTLAAYGFIVIGIFSLIYAIYLLVTGDLVIAAISLFDAVFCAFAARSVFADLKKLREPTPLVSRTYEFKTESHTVQIAFQMPAEFHTVPIQGRIRITAQAALYNFKEEGLAEILEERLTKDVIELKIPIFRIQILGVSKVIPTEVEEKKKDQSIYI